MVFQANHGLVPRQGRQRGADGGNRFDKAGMHAAVDDAIRLPVMRTDLHFGDNFIGGGANEMNAHGSIPSAGGSVGARHPALPAGIRPDRPRA